MDEPEPSFPEFTFEDQPEPLIHTTLNDYKEPGSSGSCLDSDWHYHDDPN